MQVRESLLSRQKVLEHKEKSRKLRELKKYGKKVGHPSNSYTIPPVSLSTITTPTQKSIGSARDSAKEKR